MRLAAFSPLLGALLLGGCAGSGFWRYEANTFTLPGANPNRPAGSSETYVRVRHAPAPPDDSSPMLTEAGDVWPGPPAPVPTLQDLQRQQNTELGSAGVGGAVPGGQLSSLPPLPSLPGFEVPQQVQANPTPAPSFPGSAVPSSPGRAPLHFGEPQNYHAIPGPAGRESIVVPNGNGTSTVIGPNGQVSTIPTPKE